MVIANITSSNTLFVLPTFPEKKEREKLVALSDFGSILGDQIIIRPVCSSTEPFAMPETRHINAQAIQDPDIITDMITMGFEIEQKSEFLSYLGKYPAAGPYISEVCDLLSKKYVENTKIIRLSKAITSDDDIVEIIVRMNDYPDDLFEQFNNLIKEKFEIYPIDCHIFVTSDFQ